MKTIAIIMPVRDEEATIEKAVAALADQRGVDEWTLGLHIFLDRCTDGSEGRLRRLIGELGISVNVICDGENERGGDGARRRALDAVLATYTDHEPDIVLFTDADSVVPRNWVEASILALTKVDVVAGFPQIDPLPPVARSVFAYEDRLRTLERLIYPMRGDTAPSHSRIHGSSIGFSSSAIKCFRQSNDTVFDWIAKAPFEGVVVQHSRSVTVETSGRSVGRDVRGLAGRLGMLQTERDHVLVADPLATWNWAERCRFARHVHRMPWADPSWVQLSQTLRRPIEQLQDVAARYALAETFVYEEIGPRPSSATCPIAQARETLDALIRRISLGH